MNDVIYEGFDIEPNITELNRIVKRINNVLKDNEIRKFLKSISVTYELLTNSRDHVKFTIEFSIQNPRLIECSYTRKYYTFRYYPMKEKFEKFFKEANYNLK